MQLLEGYPSLAGQISEAMIDAFHAQVADYRLDAVAHAAKRLASGQVEGRDNAYPPNASELSHQARLFDGVLRNIEANKVDAEKLIVVPIGEKPPEGFVPLGPVSVDFGKGNIDLSGKSHAEKEAILAAGGQEPIDTERHAELPDNVRKALGAKVGSM